jgi:hypothetical protein
MRSPINDGKRKGVKQVQDKTESGLAALGGVINLGDLVTLTAGGEDQSTEGKRDPYD